MNDVGVTIGVTLPDHIEGIVPVYNNDDGWMDVLDEATKQCARFWHKKIYNGFIKSVNTFTSDDPIVKSIKGTHALLYIEKQWKEYEYSSFARGHHVYMNIWNPLID